MRPPRPICSPSNDGRRKSWKPLLREDTQSELLQFALILLRRLASKLTGCRHAIMKRNRVEVEAVGPGKRPEFHKDTCEEHSVLERPHHFPVACHGRGKVVHAGRAVGKGDPQSEPAYLPHRDDVNHWGLRLGSISR